MKLTAEESDALLSRIASVLGFCLRPEDHGRLVTDPPETPDEFADQILLSEGLDPATYNRDVRKDLLKLVNATFDKHDEDDFQQMIVDSID